MPFQMLAPNKPFPTIKHFAHVRPCRRRHFAARVQRDGYPPTPGLLGEVRHRHWDWKWSEWSEIVDCQFLTKIRPPFPSNTSTTSDGYRVGCSKLVVVRTSRSIFRTVVTRIDGSIPSSFQ